MAAHDVDGNQWIDEQDPVFSQLALWNGDAVGNQQLVGLGARGVGAIFLGRAGTPFSVMDRGASQPHAVVRTSGLYLNEDGSAGTVQQLDLVV